MSHQPALLCEYTYTIVSSTRMEENARQRKSWFLQKIEVYITDVL